MSTKARKTIEKTKTKKTSSNMVKLKKLQSLQTVNKPIIHKCQICSETFPDKTTLVHHFLTHAKPPPKPTPTSPDDFVIKCDWCPMEFLESKMSQAFRHKSIKHRTEGHSFNCEFCGRSFGFSFQLARHLELEHVEEKETYDVLKPNFPCHECHTNFANEQALNTHLKKHQTGLEVFFVPKASRRLKLNCNGEVSPIFYCPWCSSEYILKYNLRRHIKEDHQDFLLSVPEEIKTCHQCNAVFFTRKAFNSHNNHSVNDLFMPEGGLPNLKVDLD